MEKQKLRVWWIPQIPLKKGEKSFIVEVESVREGKKLLEVLANYDTYQYMNKIKPDYSNAGGLEIFEDNYWVEWHCVKCYENIVDCECFKED